MYLPYWHLNEKPFQNIPDIRYAFLSVKHREGLARLVYLAETRQHGGVLTGPYGAGKTMILELLAAKLSQKENTLFLKLDVPPNGAHALARQIARKIGFKGTVMEITDTLNALEDFCQSEHGGRMHVVLALDEAHLLREEKGWEFLRLITNLTVRANKDAPPVAAVTLLLAGHDHMVDLLVGDPALVQRLHIIWRLEPLDFTEVIEYVNFRVRTAGGDIWMFEEDALRELYEASGGIPRVVNNICDMALLQGQAANATKVNRDIMRHAIQELHLSLNRAASGQEPAQ